MQSEILDKDQKRGDFKEVFNLGEFLDGKAQQPLPKSMKDHEKDLSDFASACHALCMKLIRYLEIGLKIDDRSGGADWFSSRHAPKPGTSSCTLRLLHYPAVPEDSDYDPEVDIRAVRTFTVVMLGVRLL
jgi:isopenicillin N synthase-like dioxygenase